MLVFEELRGAFSLVFQWTSCLSPAQQQRRSLSDSPGKREGNSGSQSVRLLGHFSEMKP
jgi:hypothetical protein